MKPLLEVKSLSMETLAGQPIIDNVSFSVAPSEVVALIGESGAGKSTIGLSALGYRRPGLRFSGGEVLLDGQDMLSATADELRARRGRRVAYVAQSAAAAFNAVHSLGWQITEAPIQHGVMKRSEAAKQMVSLATRMHLPEPQTIGKRYPHEVSGGQLQRLMAIMAMSCKPDLLVLDEPTTALDVTTQVEVLAALKETIKQTRTSAIYVSHDLAVVAQIADRIIVLQNGRIIEVGTTAQILQTPQEEYTRRLLSAVQVVPKATAVARTRTAVTTSTEVPVLTLEGIDASYPPHNSSTGPKVLHNINLEIPKGKVFGVIGESGSGKSTIAKVVAGLLPQSAGEVRLNGVALSRRIPKRSLQQRRDVQLVVQMPDLAFNPARTVKQALDRHLAFFTDLNAAQRTGRIADLLRTVELDPALASRMPQHLSGGQKQRVSLARALAVEPSLMLCDEVTSALDTVVAASVVALLKKLKREIGQSMMFISHDIATVAELADEVLVLYQGQIVEHKPLIELLAAPAHPYTRKLLASVPELRPGWIEEHRLRAGLPECAEDVAEEDRRASV